MRESMLQWEYSQKRKYERELTLKRSRQQSRMNALRRKKSITAQDIINGAKRLFK